MHLIIEDDGGRRTVIAIARDAITLGRDEDNTVRLPERDVSRRHGRLVREGSSFHIEDLGSLTGIRVNGEKIAGRREVRDGDLIEIGGYDLMLEADLEERPGEGDARNRPLDVSAPSVAAPPEPEDAVSQPTMETRIIPQRRESRALGAGVPILIVLGAAMVAVFVWRRQAVRPSATTIATATATSSRTATSSTTATATTTADAIRTRTPTSIANATPTPIANATPIANPIPTATRTTNEARTRTATRSTTATANANPTPTQNPTATTTLAPAATPPSDVDDPEARRLLEEGSQKLVAQDLAGAAALFQRGLSLRPQGAVLAGLYRSLGITRSRQGDFEEGTRYYRLYLSVVKNREERERVQKHLDDYEAHRAPEQRRP